MVLDSDVLSAFKLINVASLSAMTTFLIASSLGFAIEACRHCDREDNELARMPTSA